MTNHKRLQLGESSQVQFSEFRFTDAIIDDDSGDRWIEGIELIDGGDSGVGILYEIRMISQGTDIYSSLRETTLNSEDG